MFDSTYLSFDVVQWRKAVSNKSPLHPPGLSLAVSCKARGGDLQVSTEEDFRSLEFHHFVGSGPPLRGEPSRPLERGIGLLTYGREGIGGWFCLDDLHYREVWAQISNATFSSSDIHLEIAPILHRGALPFWDVVQNSSLYILGAAVIFSFEKKRS
jgi:hypothetical protein